MQDPNKQSTTATGFRMSLSRRFLLRLLAILFLGQCLTLGWSLYLNHDIQGAGISEKLTLCGKQMAAVALVSRTSFDFTYLGQLADELLKDPDIDRVSYVDNGVPILDVKNSVAHADPLKIEIPVLVGTDKVGSIDIYYSLARVNGNIVSQATISAALTAILFLFLVLFTKFFFNRDIGSKIALINANLNQVSSGDLTNRSKLVTGDELGSISAGLDYVVDWLSTTVIRIKSISTSVAAATNHLSRTFKALIDGVTQQQVATEHALIAVQNTLASQQQIITATEDLLGLSGESTTALGDILVASKGVVDKMDRLGINVDSSCSTISELSRTSSEVSAMAARANGSVEDADLAISGISSSVSKIGSIVRDTTLVSAEMDRIIADQGVKSVNDAIDSMQNIDQLVTSLSTTISSLGGRSNDIARILEVIKEVTDQTKLLSLNAQILSAQAGIYGHPFAVVSAEMKALSNKTALSTKEIETIVSAIQMEMSSAVNSAIAASEMVSEGKAVAEKVSQALLRIQEASRQSNQMVGTIQVVADNQDQDLQGIIRVFDEIKTLIKEVNRATRVENDGIQGLQQDFDTIRAATSITRSASESQVKSIQLISENFLMANDKTSEIATATKKQHAVSVEMITAMEKVSRISTETVKGVTDVATRISGISDEVNFMHHEIEMIKTETEAIPETETERILPAS
ncbi:MAG: methyl-accepting chemotaxis protein [Desulfuromonadaceae bacterium]|nr:methyl-accepting chemotaxis protein [Desulfuromonadaceae bacterium]